MNTTIKEIAKIAGVSIGTVSLALRDDRRITEQTKKRVLEIAQSLNYVPSNLGRGLQARKSFLIGYMVSSIHGSFYSEILQGIGNITTANNYGLMVAVTEEDHESEMRQLKLFEENKADGIILSSYARETVPYLKKLHASGIPMIACDFESFAEDIPASIIDNREASRLLVEHLASLGHISIAYAYDINDNSHSRYEWCLETARAHGISHIHPCSSKAALSELLTSSEPPTAVICYSDHMAVEVKHLTELLGVHVPQDLSVTGFDDMIFASWPEFNLTTIEQPKMQIGIYAAEMLFQLMNGQKVETVKHIPPRLIIRGSTAKCK